MVALGKYRKVICLTVTTSGGSVCLWRSQVAGNVSSRRPLPIERSRDTYVAFRANNDGNTVSIDLSASPQPDPPAIASGWNVNRGLAVAVRLLSLPLMARIT